MADILELWPRHRFCALHVAASGRDGLVHISKLGKYASQKNGTPHVGTRRQIDTNGQDLPDLAADEDSTAAATDAATVTS